jgi:peroxiredoxin
MKLLVASFLLFVSSSCFTQNIIDLNISAKEWMDSFAVNMQKLIGKEMDHFSVLSDEGRSYTNDSLKGKVTLVNFWFEACAPCVAEFEELNKLNGRIKNRKFQLLSFTFETPDAIKRIKEKYKLEFEVISISEKECRRLNFNYGFPFNIIVDESSKIANIHHGGSIDKTEAGKNFNIAIIPEIKKLLDTK